MTNSEQYNLRKLINNHFFDRDQTKEILENFVTVNNQGVLHVGLPEPTSVALTTPNNAITTADMGTLKATVTGAANVKCYGVPVEFVNKKTQQVLGYGLTDLNGEVYHNFRLDDADIFDVQARLSQDYLFNDFAVLNNTHTWNNNSNIVREIYEDHTKIYLDDDTSYGYLCSPVLSGFVDIDFKVKLNDGVISDTFCGLFTTNSTGTVSGTINGFNLGQLGLTSSNIGRWVDFHIGVLDDTIILLCKDTGAMVKLSHTCPSYYIFCFALTGTLTDLDFRDVKINKCSDDLTMFVKDKNNLFNHNLWSGTDLNKSLIYNTEYSSGHLVTVSSNSNFSTNGNYSIELNPSETAWVRFPIPFTSEDINKIVTASFELYSPNTNCEVHLLFMDGNNNVIEIISTAVAKNNSFTTITISNEIVANTSKIWFNCSLSSSDVIIYLDNLTATIQ